MNGKNLYGVCADGGILCADCISECLPEVNGAIDSDCPDDAQWKIVGFGVVDNEEMEELVPVECDHCYRVVGG